MTSYTPDQAYAQIKALEAAGELQIHPLGVQTVVVGTYDATANKFTYAVPTGTVAITDNTPPPGAPVGKPITIHLTVGEVVYCADTLMLQVDIVNAKTPVSVGFNGGTVTAPVGQSTVTIGSGGWVSASVTGGSYTYASLTVTNGTAKVIESLQIFNLPLLGAGVLTLPAVPMALVYAPPPGAESKNYALYTDIESVGRKIESSVVSGSVAKTSTAYTTSDFVTKANGVLSAIGNLGGQGSPLKAALGPVAAAITLLIGIIDDTSATTTNSVSTTSDHALTATTSWGSSYQTPAGAGPGLGDRFIYIRNVRLAWMIYAGQLSFMVLDDDGSRNFTARQLIADQTAMQATGGPAVGPATNLDATTVATLLALDPFVGNANPKLPAPRFVLDGLRSFGGGDTGVGGTTYTETHDITVTDTDTTNTVWTVVTDYKPGWLKALFGNNQATENQISFATTSTVQTSVENKQTVTAYFFSYLGDPSYETSLYYDTFFNTIAFAPATTAESVPTTGKS